MVHETSWTFLVLFICLFGLYIPSNIGGQIVTVTACIRSPPPPHSVLFYNTVDTRHYIPTRHIIHNYMGPVTIVSAKAERQAELHNYPIFSQGFDLNDYSGNKITL